MVVEKIIGNCPECGKNDGLEKITKEETVQVRDLMVVVNRVYRHCNHCGLDFENTKDYDWRKDAFDKYREKMGMKSPEEIRNWREKYSLTQTELAALLGWGEATVGRYEKGSLPSVAQSEMLEKVMTPSGLLDAISKRPEVIPAEKLERIYKEIYPLVLDNTYRDLLVKLYSNHSARLTGCTNFVCEKAAALISVLSDRGVHKTKLNKLMFYSDFLHYSRHRKSITGIPYARIGFGPVPEEYDTLFASMKALNFIEVEEEEFYGYNAERIHAIDKGVRSNLSSEEINTAKIVLARFEGWSTKAVVEYSHKERAWTDVEHKQKIPYDYADSLSLKDS